VSRRRGPRGLQVERGERYALLPRDVAEEPSYNAQTDWSRTVLTAVLLQYHGHNNGLLGLTFAQARPLGVSAQWKLYAGLRLLCDADLLKCTRRGELRAGEKLPSLYAITWKGIDEPTEGIVYDSWISVSPIPCNAWAKWQKPANWQEHVKSVERRFRRGDRKENPVASREVTFTAHVRSGKAFSRSSSDVKEAAFPAPHVDVTSEISAPVPKIAGTVDRAIAGLLVKQPHLLDGDIARTCSTDALRVATVRARLADGWTP
jgi:hypothetical protein